MAAASLLDAVADLRRDVDRTRFVLPLANVPAAEARRRQLLDQLDDHLLPRLRELSAPAVVVIAGSTGAGKSTVLNSLLGRDVSAAGVLRPTTRRPVLAHHPDDGELLAGHPLLPIADVVVSDVVPRGIALVDAPDLDSLLESNRSTAHRLLEAADLWIFVTTAARYGDALPWTVLVRASERGTAMAMVLNRVPADAMTIVRTDLLRRLRERRLAQVPVFVIPDAGPHEGLLDARTTAPILRWLAMVSGADRARSVIARTQRGSLVALRPWVEELADAVQDQVDARAAIEAVVAEAVEVPAQRAAEVVTSGSVADGPLRGRWAAFARGAGPLAGRWRSRRGRAARTHALEQVAGALHGSVVVVLAGARRRGAVAVHRALASSDAPGAMGLREAIAEPGSDGGGPAPTPEQSAGEWMLTVDEAVRAAAGAADRSVARRVQQLMDQAGPGGAQTLVGAAAAGLGAARAVLTTALGEPATQELVSVAEADLVDRAQEQARAAAGPVLAHLDSADLAPDAASLLRLRLAVLKGLR